MKYAVIGLFLGLCLNVQSQDRMPVQYREADRNGDGFIDVDEVQRMIDGFFIGTHDHGVMYIHNLIDFFFEQPYE